MQADFSVELGAQDDLMELPWAAASADGPRYYDLKRQPELLLNVEEAFKNRELGEFLAAINSRSSILESSKCDVWYSDQLNAEEKIYGGEGKFASYIDLIFSEPVLREAFAEHELFVKEICTLLKRAPEISSAAEFVVRRCYYRTHPQNQAEHIEGFGITFYLFGYGADRAEARQRWAIALKVVENALLQLSAAYRRKMSAAP